jgi:hypothetical protein
LPDPRNAVGHGEHVRRYRDSETDEKGSEHLKETVARGERAFDGAADDARAPLSRYSALAHGRPGG